MLDAKWLFIRHPGSLAGVLCVSRSDCSLKCRVRDRHVRFCGIFTVRIPPGNGKFWAEPGPTPGSYIRSSVTIQLKTEESAWQGFAAISVV